MDCVELGWMTRIERILLYLEFLPSWYSPIDKVWQRCPHESGHD